MIEYEILYIFRLDEYLISNKCFEIDTRVSLRILSCLPNLSLKFIFRIIMIYTFIQFSHVHVVYLRLPDAGILFKLLKYLWVEKLLKTRLKQGSKR